VRQLTFSRGHSGAAGRRGAFSIVEMLVALSITATLLTATMVALDSSYKSYKITTEGASTNVISRMVMHRMITMIRTGENFGPYPIDPLDVDQNPVRSNSIEFETFRDEATNRWRIVSLERRAATEAAQGPFELWYVQVDFTDGVESAREQRPLITGVQDLWFTLEYDVGPRLARATVDFTVRPNDFQEASFHNDLETPTIRLVSSVSPRRLEAED